MGDFNSFVWWVFCGLLSGCALYGVTILARLTESVQQLHETLAKLLEKTEWHEKALERHENRIAKIEDRI